jgi:energy-coupling factor transporter ATP-binding protein EcfA2
MNSNSKTAETNFLVDFFSLLNQNNITYCILRNYESLPYDLKGSDIDLFVQKCDFELLHIILENCAKKFGGNVISKLTAPSVKDVAITGYHNGEWWGVRFDTFTYIGTNDYSIFSNEYIINRIEFYNDIKVVKKNDALVIGFIKEIIGAKKYSKKYAKGALKAYREEQEIYDNAFCDTLSADIVEGFLIPLLKNKMFFSHKTCGILFRGYKKRAFKNDPINFLTNIFFNLKYKFVRLLKTPGFSIAVLGTDGAGKSTIINMLTPLLQKSLHNEISYSHMRPNMFPNIAQLFGKPYDSTPNTNPHGGGQSNFGISLIRLTYYWIDYVIGYWVVVNITLAKKTTIWFFDRYYYDYIIDQKRGGIKLPIGIIKLFGIFVPTPDLILCLGTTPELINSRKPELPIEDVRIQVQKLKSFCANNKNAFWIETGNKSIESTVNYAMVQIILSMSNRYKK